MLAALDLSECASARTVAASPAWIALPSFESRSGARFRNILYKVATKSGSSADWSSRRDSRTSGSMVLPIQELIGNPRALIKLTFHWLGAILGNAMSLKGKVALIVD